MKKARACPERASASRGGFSLIEAMVVITVLAIIAAVGSSTLFTILRGSTKTQTMLMVRQQGEYATSVMVKMIRNARKIENNSSNSLTIRNPDNFSTTFSCLDNGAYKYIASAAAAFPTTTPVPITSADVTVESCASFFAVATGVPKISPDTVKINFKLMPAILGGRPEEQSIVNFDTAVSLRNY